MDRNNVWAPVGIDISNATSLHDALVISGLDFKVSKKPLFDEAGKKIEGFFGTQRSDNDEWLGQVGSRYTIVQNENAFDFIDNLVAEGVSLERAGVWKNGTAVWIEGKLPDQYKILGDEVEAHVIFINSHDGKGAVKSCLLPTRIACSNQINFALASSPRVTSIVHSNKVDARMKAAGSVLVANGAYITELAAECEMFANKKISEYEWNAIMNSLYPIDPTLSERRKNNMIATREAINAAITRSDLDNFNGTAYKYLQAMADYTSHRESGRTTARYFDARLMKVAAGDPELDAVYRALKAA